MMIESVEYLYDRIFDTITELIDTGEDPDRLYDCIIDHFAFMAEDSARRQKIYGALLNKFRDNDPIVTVPEDEVDVDNVDLTAPPTFEELYGGMNEINQIFMSENQDMLANFMRSAQFPDKLDS